jgi:phosphoribosylformylglycinamidine synthase
VKAAVIVFPGSNCDRDVAMALEASLGRPPLMVWHREADFPEVDLIVVPGGFSYGDYLRAGAMAAHSPVVREVVRRAREGVAVLGICNGFQILAETRLLPGVLLRNGGLKFICRDVYLRVEAEETPFTVGYRRGQVIRIPIAHHDGNYFTDRDTLKELLDDDRVAFRYCGPDGEVNDEHNPNGSLESIAGVLNKGRNVLGMMPHPERLADPHLGGTDGRAMFDGLVQGLS